MAPTEAHTSDLQRHADQLLDLADEAARAADSHASAAQRIAQPCNSYSYGDNSGTTEGHTAAIAYATEAQVHATLALAAELRSLRLTLAALQ